MTKLITLDDIDGAEEIRTFLGKWIPLEFNEIKWKPEITPEYQSQRYTFDFGRIEVNSGNFGWGIMHRVRAYSSWGNFDEYDLDKLFEPNIRQTFLDCKDAFRDALIKWGETYSDLKGLNIEDYVRFERRTSFLLSVDVNNLPGDITQQYDEAGKITERFQDLIGKDIKKK